MGKFVIEGGKRLCGKIKAERAKNSVLPIIAASLLTEEEVVIKDCPDIADVKNMLAIVSELGGEKIDIIPWSENPLEYISMALSPARVVKVVQTGDNSAMAIVPDDKLSLAIGRSGQNARLAVRLTNWKIDVKSESAALAELGEDAGAEVPENAEVEENAPAEE